MSDAPRWGAQLEAVQQKLRDLADVVDRVRRDLCAPSPGANLSRALYAERVHDRLERADQLLSSCVVVNRYHMQGAFDE